MSTIANPNSAGKPHRKNPANPKQSNNNEERRAKGMLPSEFLQQLYGDPSLLKGGICICTIKDDKLRKVMCLDETNWRHIDQLAD